MTSSLVRLPHRSIVTLQGPDTITLLERLVTNYTSNWAVGDTRYGALLTPQGKVIADYLALRTEDGVQLDVSSDHAPDLAKRLKMFRLRSQVEIEVREDLFVFAGLEAHGDSERDLQEAMSLYRDPRYSEGRLRLVGDRDDAFETTRTLADYHADRIANVIPEQGPDFGAAEVFPAEINMDVLDGVALNKGCFVGQEVVSRMHRRGKIRKRALRLSAPEGIMLHPGTEIAAPLPIGTVTSAAGNHGLAVVRVDRLVAAEQAGESTKIGETLVTLEKPGWLVHELASMQGA
nr:folate-binding protein YgfZ [Hyphomonas sp. Mor2]